MIDRKEIGQRLRDAREKTGLSRDAVIALPEISISRTTLQQWEIGQTEPSLEKLAKLADLYKVSPQWLIFGEGGNTGNIPAINPATGVSVEQAIDTLKNLIEDSQPKLTEDEAFLLKEFRALAPDQQRLMLRFLVAGFDGLNNGSNSNNHNTYGNNNNNTHSNNDYSNSNHKGVFNSPNTKITGSFTG